jgi:hypothetical protein
MSSISQYKMTLALAQRQVHQLVQLQMSHRMLLQRLHQMHKI